MSDTKAKTVFTKAGRKYSVQISNNEASIKNKWTGEIYKISGPRIVSMLIEELMCYNPDWTTDDVLQSYSTLFDKK